MKRSVKWKVNGTLICFLDFSNIDLQNQFGGIFGVGRSAEAQANAAISMTAATTAAQTTTAQAQIQAQQDIENKKTETFKMLGIGAIIVATFFVVFKFLW